MIKHGYRLLGLAVVALILGTLVFADAKFFWLKISFVLACFGAFYSVKGRSSKPEVKKVSVYKFPNTLLTVTFACLVLIILMVADVRRQAGYSGSEGEIVAIPFILVLFILVPTTLISYIITFIVNNRKS